MMNSECETCGSKKVCLSVRCLACDRLAQFPLCADCDSIKSATETNCPSCGGEINYGADLTTTSNAAVSPIPTRKNNTKIEAPKSYHEALRLIERVYCHEITEMGGHFPPESAPERAKLRGYMLTVAMASLANLLRKEFKVDLDAEETEEEEDNDAKD